MTSQKQLIFNIIQHSGAHLTAKEILEEARKIQPSIAVGTVYRNLSILCEEGEIRKISVPNQPDYYDRFTKPHSHMVCSVCGHVDDAPFDRVMEYLQEQTNQNIEKIDLTAYYTCAECAQKNEQKP